MLVVLDCETFSKYHFFNRHFVVHDNEKDVEMATWSVICMVESENTYQTAAYECIWLPDRYYEVCVKNLMDKIKNFNVNMDVLSYMKRMKDDDILDLRAWQSEMVFFWLWQWQKWQNHDNFHMNDWNQRIMSRDIFCFWNYLFFNNKKMTFLNGKLQKSVKK